MGFLKFLFITIMILWVIRMIIRLIFPMVLKGIFGKMQQQTGGMGQQQQQQQQSSRRPEGSINIDYMPPKQKTGNADKLGDFVDYEELK